MVVMKDFHLLLINIFKDADMIIHAGDVLLSWTKEILCFSDYNPAKLAEKLNACSMPVVICRGNCDSEVDTFSIRHANSSTIYLCSSRRFKNSYYSWSLCRNR